MENPFRIIIDYLIELTRIANIIISNIKDLSDKTSSSNSDDVLGFNDAQKFLGVSKATLYKWTSEESIPHYKPEGKLFFIREELVEWIKSGKVKTKWELDEEAEKFIKSRSKK